MIRFVRFFAASGSILPQHAAAAVARSFPVVSEVQIKMRGGEGLQTMRDRLYFPARDLIGCGLVGVVEEQLIAVEINDDEEPVAPRTLLDRNTLAHEL